MKDSTPDYMRASIYLALGIAYQNTEEFDKAIAALQKGIEKTPQGWKLHNSLGLTYKIVNNLQESFLSYFRAQEISSKKQLILKLEN